MPPASAPVMVMLAEVDAVGDADGVRPRVGAAGGPLSRVHVAVAAGPALPAASTRRTSKVTGPSGSGPIDSGLVHDDHAPEPTLHW